MTKLVSFLGRKSVPQAQKATAAAAAPQLAKSEPPTSANPQIELDQDLFLPIASQLGKENEAVRHLLIDAEHKIDELDVIKRSIGKLVEPVSRTLRAYEETKNEKLSLQNVLNSTRIAHNKLRDDLDATKKRAATFEAESTRLRDMLTLAQQSVAALEQVKAEHVAELTSRRGQIAELQRLVQSQGTDLQITREDNRRLGERLAVADRKMVQFEATAEAAQQQALQAIHERTAVQAALDKALNEYSQTARRLTDTDKALGAARTRLKVLEADLAEAQAERSRLALALDEANHKHSDEINLQRSRFDALQARAALTERLLEEARETMSARSEEIRAFERRVLEAASDRDNAGERLVLTERTLAEREERIADLEQVKAILHEQNTTLGNAVAAREHAYNRAQQKVLEQEELVALLEGQIKTLREATEMQTEQLNAQLQREQLERSMAEGAVESSRKDIARLLREIAMLQQRPTAMASELGEEAERLERERLRSAA